MVLPKPIDDIWYYYKTLTCVTFVKERRFVTLVNLPLLDLNSQFELYQIHNVPLPYPNARMTAFYELETTTFAVNVKRTDFILLTLKDLARCSNPATKFCTLRSPLYNLGESKFVSLPCLNKIRQR